MPWSQTSPMDQKRLFVADYYRDVFTMAELCQSFGISRKTGYKWLDRFEEEGPAGLNERSRRPESSPSETARELVDALLELRRRHPNWGAKSS